MLMYTRSVFHCTTHTQSMEIRMLSPKNCRDGCELLYISHSLSLYIYFYGANIINGASTSRKYCTNTNTSGSNGNQQKQHHRKTQLKINICNSIHVFRNSGCMLLWYPRAPILCSYTFYIYFFCAPCSHSVLFSLIFILALFIFVLSIFYCIASHTAHRMRKKAHLKAYFVVSVFRFLLRKISV